MRIPVAALFGAAPCAAVRLRSDPSELYAAQPLRQTLDAPDNPAVKAAKQLVATGGKDSDVEMALSAVATLSARGEEFRTEDLIASVKRPDADGNSLFMNLCKLKYSHSARLILQWLVDDDVLDAKDSEGNNCLHWAVRNDDEALITDMYSKLKGHIVELANARNQQSEAPADLVAGGNRRVRHMLEGFALHRGAANRQALSSYHNKFFHAAPPRGFNEPPRRFTEPVYPLVPPPPAYGPPPAYAQSAYAPMAMYGYNMMMQRPVARAAYY